MTPNQSTIMTLCKFIGRCGGRTGAGQGNFLKEAVCTGKDVNCCKTQKKKKKITINYGDQSTRACYDAMPCLHTAYESEHPDVLLVNATEHVVGDLTIGRKLQKTC